MNSSWGIEIVRAEQSRLEEHAERSTHPTHLSRGGAVLLVLGMLLERDRSARTISIPKEAFIIFMH